jgi:hypothetical protein
MDQPTETTAFADRPPLPEQVSQYKQRSGSKDSLAYYFEKRLEILENLEAGIEADRNTDTSGAVKRFIEKDVTVQEREKEHFEANLHRELKVANQNLDAEYETIDVTDHGAVGDGTTNDLPAFDEATQAAKETDSPVRIYLPSGDYALRNTWKIDGLTDAVIEGEDETTIVGKDQGYGLSGGNGRVLFPTNCENVRFRNLAIDMDPLPFTQGTVTATDPDARTVTFELDTKVDGSTFLSPDHDVFRHAELPRVLIREPNSTELAPFITEHFIVDSDIIADRLDPIDELESFGVEEVGENTYELTVNINGAFESSWAGSVEPNLERIEQGQTLNLIARSGGEHAIDPRGNELVTFENFDVYSSYRYAFICRTANTSMKWIDVNIAPRNDSRYQSVNADGINTREDGIGPFIYDSSIVAQGDDPINFHTNLFTVADTTVGSDEEIEIGGRMIRHPKTYEPGDELAFVRDDPPRITGFATVAAAESVGGEYARDKPFHVTMESTISEGISDGDMVLNIDNLGGGFVIADTEFLDNRASGGKIYTTDGIVENLDLTKDLAFFSNLNNQQGWPIRTITARSVTSDVRETYRHMGQDDETRLFRRLPST